MRRLICLFAATIMAGTSTACTMSAPADQPAYTRAAPASAAHLDPPRHRTHPARNRQLLIPSGPPLAALGRPAEMNALFLLAAGEGPHPTMVLLHGLPGNERNLDLAQAVRRAGWNVLTFTYRGAWGSEGTFSIGAALEDAGAALAYVRSPAAAREYAIDPRRLVIAGHSMGGLAAAWQGAADDALAGVILLDAWDIGTTARGIADGGAGAQAAFAAGLDDLGHAIGPVSGAQLAEEVARRGSGWSLAQTADGLARKPVLSIYAAHGLAAENRAFAALLSGRHGAQVSAAELDSDHSFADHRLALAEEVVRWLEALGR